MGMKAIAGMGAGNKGVDKEEAGKGGAEGAR